MAEMHTLTLHRLAWVVVPRAAAESQRHLDLLCCLLKYYYFSTEYCYCVLSDSGEKSRNFLCDEDVVYSTLEKQCNVYR